MGIPLASVNTSDEGTLTDILTATSWDTAYKTIHMADLTLLSLESSVCKIGSWLAPESLDLGRVSAVLWGFPAGSAVKNLPAVEGTWVWSLGQEDPLEKEMATHSSILGRMIPRTKEPGGLQSMGLQESIMT